MSGKLNIKMSSCNDSVVSLSVHDDNKSDCSKSSLGNGNGTTQESNHCTLNEERSHRLLLNDINDRFCNEKDSSRKRPIESDEDEYLSSNGLKIKCIHDHDITPVNQSSKKSNIRALPNVLPGSYTNLTKLGRKIDDFYLIVSKINSNKKSQNNYVDTSNENESSDKTNSNRPKLYWARHIATGFPVVIKVVKRARVVSSSPGSYSVWKRLCLKLLSLPYHPNVMKIYQVFEDDENFYLVMEGLEGGELFQFLISEQAIPEETCKYIIRQILESVNHLHCLKMLHRDVKPENIMFRYKKREEKPYSPMSISSLSTIECADDKLGLEGNRRYEYTPHLSLKSSRESFEIVLVDFDTCELIDDQCLESIKMRKRLVGTFGYLAPEVLNGGEYSEASDLWSIGIILYILMTGIPPLRIDLMCDYSKAMEVLRTISDQGGFQFDAPPLPDFPLAQDLCIRLLQWDPKKRIQSCQQALKHPWLADSFIYNPIGPLYKPNKFSINIGGALNKNNETNSAREIEDLEELCE